MPVVALYDACVLYPAPLRDLLMHLALTGLFQARWTDAILDESFRNILANRPDLSSQRLQRTREMMNGALPDARVLGYEDLIPTLSLPDPDDRHVFAAAIRCNAHVIVTFNLRDFPERALRDFGIIAQHPDEFITSLIARSPSRVYEAVVRQAASMRNPPHTVAELLETLQRQGLRDAVAGLKAHAGLQ